MSAEMKLSEDDAIAQLEAEKVRERQEAERLALERDAKLKQAEEDAKQPDVVPVTPSAFVFSGRVGGTFNIDGDNLGVLGTVLIDGQAVEVTRWNERSIKGMVPKEGFKPGDVVVTVNGKKVRSKLS